jgi:serine protease Do
MAAVHLRLLVAAGLTASACASSSPAPVATAPSAPSATTTPDVAELRGAVFEVVVPKYEPPGVTYAEPLPVHLLSHADRNDKFHSIGTAFTLDGTTFVSAAHVFSLEDETQYPAMRLRAADGTIHEIDRFVAYSGVRDLVVFTLRTPPAVARPLVRGAQPAIGAQVFTVGNALGEGLAVRGGNVASFTPEPLDGSWQFVRYSAPASPGNSGGPLLDARGRVVGVVVRRSSDENLNYAIPIEELDRLSSQHGDFYRRYSEYEADSKLVIDWKFEVDLPADYQTLAAQARAGWNAGLRENRVAFEAKFKDQLFPTSPELRTFLREQASYFFPSEVVRGADGRWHQSAPRDGSSVEVDGEQRLFLGQTGEYTYVVLERPDNVPLAAFLAEPARVMDAVLRKLDIRRTFANAKIRVTSYGEPHRQESWRDELGRPWTSTTWRRPGDSSSTLHCTPYPRGLACILAEEPTAWEPTHVMYAKINAKRWTLSYDGRLRDWIEFLALPAELRPTFLTGAVALKGPTLTVRLDEVGFELSNPAFGPDSLLFARIEYESFAPAALRVMGVEVLTAKSRGVALRLERVLEPLPTSSQGYREFWDKLLAAKAPFDGKIVREGESSQMHVTAATPAIELLPEAKVAARAQFSCRSNDNAAVSDKELEKMCATFRKSITIHPGAPAPR